MTNRTVFTLINSQNGNLAFKLFSFEDNSYFDYLQRLNYYSIILVVQGEGKLKVDFSEYDFVSNTLMCFSPYQPYMIISKAGLKGIAINFHPDFFCIHKHHKEVACNGVLFNNVFQPPMLTVGEKDASHFCMLIEHLKTEMQNPSLAQYELLVSYLKIFLINASRLKVDQYSLPQQALGDSKEPFILQNLMDSIEQNYKAMHTAGDYANLLNVSAKTLARVSKTYFNRTLTDLISERIIIEAKRELYLTSKSVKEIAYDLGFNDEYYFSRFFKNNADVAPQIYRDTVGFARGEA